MRYLLGVTGSMGCGKSYVCERLEEEAQSRGIELCVISFDEERKRVVQTPEIKEQLVNYFGEIILQGSVVDRKKLAEQMFSDTEKRVFAEHIIDSATIYEVKRELNLLSGIVLVEWARFAEKARLDLTNYNMLLIHCPYKLQLERLQGDDLPLEQIKKRISVQYSNEEKRRRILQTQLEQRRGDYYELETSGRINISRLLEEILRHAN
ncbi:dephospho-CoA kinase [archaeon]|nr:dephospho-CoA kinase [archaeon]